MVANKKYTDSLKVPFDNTKGIQEHEETESSLFYKDQEQTCPRGKVENHHSHTLPGEEKSLQMKSPPQRRGTEGPKYQMVPHGPLLCQNLSEQFLGAQSTYLP